MLHGMSEVVDLNRYFRKLGFELADGSETQAHKTTLRMLETRAVVHCCTEAVLPVGKYAQVFNKFSTDETLLAPTKSANDILSRWATSVVVPTVV